MPTGGTTAEAISPPPPQAETSSPASPLSAGSPAPQLEFMSDSSDEEEGISAPPSESRQVPHRSLRRTSHTPDLITSLIRPSSPDTLYVGAQIAHQARPMSLERSNIGVSGPSSVLLPNVSSFRRSGPMQLPHPSSLDIPKKYGGDCIFDMYSLTYLDDPDVNLLCPICHDPLVDPVTTPCDHTFCYRCLRQSIFSSPSGSACPIDREYLAWPQCFSAARLVRTQLNNLRVKCPYHGRGCKEELWREVVELHATTECRFRDFTCPGTDCDKRLRSKPTTDDCPHQQIDCPRCHATIEAPDIDLHMLSCSMSRTRCDACWKLVRRNQMINHQQLDCDGMVIACPYQELGCPARSLRGMMNAHTMTCAFHPDTPSGIIIRNQRELIQSYSDLGSQIQQLNTRQDETNRRINEVTTAVNRRRGTDSAGGDSRTMLDLDAGFEEVHQNLTHLEARQSMWTMNQVMPIREEVTELRNNINMIRMHVNWLLNRSREEGRIRAANNSGSSTMRRDGSVEGGPSSLTAPRLSSPRRPCPTTSSTQDSQIWKIAGLKVIRARRLAKLGTSTPSTSRSDDKTTPETESSNRSRAPAPSSQATSADSSRPKINITPAPSSSSQPNPASKLGDKTSSRKSESSDSAGSFRVSRKRLASEIDDADSADRTPQRSTTTSTPQPESDEDYANRTLSHVFHITVNPHIMTDSHGHRLTFLPTLNEELNDADEPLKLSVGNLDQAIMEALGVWPEEKPLMQYLLPCWKRAVKTAHTAKATKGPRHEVHEEAKRLAMSSALFSFIMPDLYGRQPNPRHDTLVPYLLKGVQADDGLCLDFIREAVKKFDEDEEIPALFVNAMLQISGRLSQLCMDDDYKPYVQALLTFTRFPTLLTHIANHPSFNQSDSATGIEKDTILGPFFRISPLQPEVIKSYFPGPRTLDKARIRNAQDAMRMVLRTHQDDLFAIANAFIRAGPDTRNRTLNWFADVMNKNHKRRAIQVDSREISSNGFMINVTTVLDRFCEPFMDNGFTKVEKIDNDYFRKNPRIDIKDETKLNADQSYSDAYYANTVPGEPNFISEAFFLTLAAHHYGSESCNTQLKNLDRDIKYLEKHLKAMEAERPKVANVPHQLRLLEETLKRHNNALEKAIGMKYAIEGVLLDERMQGTSLKFMRYVSVWLLRLVTRSNYKPGLESQEIQLPLPPEKLDLFACLPEYCLQNIVDNFKFIFRFLANILPSAVGDEMIALCITFLRSTEYIKNPYLKSSLVSLLFSATWPFMHLKRGVLGDQLISSKFANDHLLHALMRFYIECESTGADSAFYDKFNIRYEIFQVIKCVWVNDHYKRQLTQESKLNKQFFVQFVNMLLNDATYVLDEALTKFPKIRALEKQLEDQTLSAEDRQKKEEEHQTLANQATSFMQLANETLEMMKLFTEAMAEAFTMPEIVSRLASMLNYNLETLAGKKANAELSVANKDKYRFRPIQLISDIVDIYLNLGNSSVFIEAVAADGRSYKPEILDRVTQILTQRNQKDAGDIARWSKLKSKFIDAKLEIDQAELDLGEIPTEFEDPIMGDLMKDPVLLPSRHIVDRSTIVQHLLSDPKDPFTRQPMTIDDAIPQTELKERIEKWREERVQAAKEKLKEGAMDTTEG
ncbi:ubiquitin elongating factor core-domain-containing protein [Mariannaea sp. PMI_226]|nr:ubiquitin elongating factor core-domain-containing protein [Mariannaea sp. PMI_226]